MFSSASRSVPRSGDLSPETFLEPMMSVGLRIERIDLAIAGVPVELNRLLQRTIRLQPEGREPELARLGLQRREHPPAQAQPTDAAGHPHSFEVSDPGRHGLHPATGDRLAIHESDEERAARRDEVMVVGRQGGGRIEPRFEAPAQLLEVLVEAPAGGRACRLDPLDLFGQHSLTLVNDLRPVKEGAAPGLESARFLGLEGSMKAAWQVPTLAAALLLSSVSAQADTPVPRAV